MNFSKHLQAPKCPACEKKVNLKELGSPKPFDSQPAPAGQCPECKVDLRWVRSREKILVMTVSGLVFLPLLMLLISMVLGDSAMALEHRVGVVLAGSIALGFLNGKELVAFKASGD
ncbi:MAG: hypothetical protein LBV29_00100 [Azoarcus sp.]|jgi:endogenous inhibitor of DNA gyrase (YacG/DUF329 family)|nr:hypothetical protein [Azoarcus sp.]